LEGVFKIRGLGSFLVEAAVRLLNSGFIKLSDLTIWDKCLARK
jgi:hypothetical protein